MAGLSQTSRMTEIFSKNNFCGGKYRHNNIKNDYCGGKLQFALSRLGLVGSVGLWIGLVTPLGLAHIGVVICLG